MAGHPIDLTRQPVTLADPLLTMTETAAMLRKSTKALAWMLHAGTAPKSGLIGGRRMFRTSDVNAYISAAFDETEAS